MKTLYKRCLLLGLSLSIVALAGLRTLLERELGKEIEGQGGGGLDGATLDAELEKLAALDLIAVKHKPQAHPPNSIPPTATTVTFSGTVVRDGSRFALRETAGVLYTLDSTGRAWPFEGEDVRVTGKLDPANRLLHVDDIQAMAS